MSEAEPSGHARPEAARHHQGEPARPDAPPSTPVTGNTYDKYGSANPLVKRMMAGFEAALDDLFAQVDPTSVLDFGCGEGVLCERWARADPLRRVVGVDLEDPKLEAEWARRDAPNLEFRTRMEFDRDEFDVAAAIEVLEHVPDPEDRLADLTRVAARYVLASVPREPVWRALNVARGAYLKDLGNTPGHVNHWSKHGFLELLARHGEVVAVRSPFPWTMALVRV